MTIENDAYVDGIQAFRPANKHAGFRFQHAITRKTLPMILMAKGSVTSEQKAGDQALGSILVMSSVSSLPS
jgi:hypothetical protein